MPRPAADLTGRKFGLLTVLTRIGTWQTYALWACRCDCGNEHQATSASLMSGKVKSCGKCDLRARSQQSRYRKAGTLRPEAERSHRRWLEETMDARHLTPGSPDDRGAEREKRYLAMKMMRQQGFTVSQIGEVFGISHQGVSGFLKYHAKEQS